MKKKRKHWARLPPEVIFLRRRRAPADVASCLARYFPTEPAAPWRAIGLTDQEHEDAFDLVACALGCMRAGGRLEHALEARARVVAQGPRGALRSAALAILSERWTPWAGLALAARILREASGARVPRLGAA